MIDLNKLRSDALKATQGEWSYHAKLSGSENHRGFYITCDGFAHAFAQPMDGDGRKGEYNASHIANNSPTTTLAFVEGIENAKRGADALARLLDDTQHAEHPDCEDGYCPVKDARSALAALREALKPFQKEAA